MIVNAMDLPVIEDSISQGFDVDFDLFYARYFMVNLLLQGLRLFCGILIIISSLSVDCLSLVYFLELYCYLLYRSCISLSTLLILSIFYCLSFTLIFTHDNQNGVISKKRTLYLSLHLLYICTRSDTLLLKSVCLCAQHVIPKSILDYCGPHNLIEQIQWNMEKMYRY